MKIRELALLLAFSIVIYTGCGVPDNIHGKTGKIYTTPVITGFSPREKNISAKDGDLLNFWINAKDSDNDPLTYTWNLQGNDLLTGELLLSGTYFSVNANISLGPTQSLVVYIIASSNNDPNTNTAEWAWIINVTR
jgi:hypothetical protein